MHSDKTKRSSTKVPCEKRRGVKKRADHNSKSNTEKNKHQLAHTGEDYFAALLTDLEQTESYDDLLAKCITYKQEIGGLNCTSPPKPDNLLTDHQSLCLVPPDILNESNLTPAEVTADGDCLPRSGSVLVFGEEDHSMEIRARIVIELATQEEVYLDPKHLKQGTNLTGKKANVLPTTFTMFSDFYIPSTKITKDIIREIFRKEVKEMTKPRTFMGIWQLFALSSIMKRAISSIYPNRGHPSVRRDLHRKIVPRENDYGQSEVSIMWTSTRTDMTHTHWVPNHFVPMVTGLAEEKQTNPTTKDLQSMPRESPNEASLEPLDLVEKEDLLNEHVVVVYDGKPYPGIVVDVDEEDLKVKCMHRIGQSRFFWPLTDDLCWYKYDDILTKIPPPAPVTGRHHQVSLEIRVKITRALE